MAKRINTIKALKNLISDDSKTLYVRWSRGFRFDSKQGESRDYQNGGTHIGLSAVEVNIYWALEGNEKWMAERVTEYLFLRMKDAAINCHIYVGIEVGKDSDGYESITEIQHIATLSNDLVKELMAIKAVQQGDRLVEYPLTSQAPPASDDPTRLDSSVASETGAQTHPDDAAKRDTNSPRRG